MAERRKATSTSSFGVGKRENHDASGFYARFTPPLLTNGRHRPAGPDALDDIFCGDSRTMTRVADDSVALVVTSPPYFAGKEYEEALGEGHVPATYFAFLDMLEEVFAECVRKLEPGGRIAVNVANLGRKPYRSLSADVIDIFQRKLRLLLRGEVIWQKARGAAGSCAWGSFQNPANPVLRDLTERVIIASKGRFDRAVSRVDRAQEQRPSEASLFKDDFFELTTDLWEIPPESATRIGHPAPFPVELPQRMIDLFTYRDDLILDPFMGSGSTAIAALRTERHFVGYDTDERYVQAAKGRVERERARLAEVRTGLASRRVVLPAVPGPGPGEEDSQSRAVREGRSAREIAGIVLRECGFREIATKHRSGSGVEVNFTAVDAEGARWHFDVSGAFTTFRPGLQRTDTLWKALGKAAVLQSDAEPYRLVLLTTDLPPRGGTGFTALANTRGNLYYDAVEMLSPLGQDRLRRYAAGDSPSKPPGELDR
ncbi:MAG: DNA-methyltransferase [Acidimicrobiia bacterium]